MGSGAATLGPGARLDRYEIESLLARGGMGEVWIARQRGELGFERRVALKTLHPALEDEADARAMMMDEARILSRVAHENVVQTLDVGRDGDVLFIVMELVSGTTLARVHAAARKKGDRVPLATALSIVSDALAGLHAAHELKGDHGEPLNVVHRDVSLENILVTEEGRAKLIDFGVAKAQGRLASKTTGVAKGKVKYMPPEQAKSQHVDRRADIWAMGAVLRILLTDEAPFAGASDVETLYMIANGQDPKPLPPEVTGSLRAALERALAMRPEDRFATAQDMRAAIDHVRTEHESGDATTAPFVLPPPSASTVANVETQAMATRAVTTPAFATTTPPTILAPSATLGGAISRRWRGTMFGVLAAAIVASGVLWVRDAREHDRARNTESSRSELTPQPPLPLMVTPSPLPAPSAPSAAPPSALSSLQPSASSPPVFVAPASSVLSRPAVAPPAATQRTERPRARVPAPSAQPAATAPVHDYGF